MEFHAYEDWDLRAQSKNLNMSSFIDPDELPFTTDEIFRAGRLFMPEESAREMADHLTEIAPVYIESRANRREGWRLGGVPNAETEPLYGWVYPEQLLPALASLSADAEARALRILEREWQGGYEGELHAARRTAAERAGLIPTREEIERRIEAELKESGRERPNGIAYRLPAPLPPATSEMEAVAEQRRAGKRRAFYEEVARFRTAR